MSIMEIAESIAVLIVYGYLLAYAILGMAGWL